MSKAGLFGLLFGWLFMITYVVNSAVAYDDTAGLSVENPIGVFQKSDGTTLDQIADLMATFWNALTFQINGLPVIFNLAFWIPTAIIGYMILAFIRGGE